MQKQLVRKIKHQNGIAYIFDEVRKKFVQLTREESVRQDFIHYLVNELSYPLSLIAVERMILYNKIRKRFDLVVFDNQGKAFMLIECKAFDVKLDNSTLFQLSTYNKTIGASIVVMTNGVETRAFRYEQDKNQMVSLNALPQYVTRTFDRHR